jgi:transcriptional regulator with GAF, ATPase, and Fis domain
MSRADTTTELLRAIGDVLDIRSAFPRVSSIANHILPHDALALRRCDPAGQARLEATCPDDLSEHGWPAGVDDDEPFSLVSDLRRLSARCSDGTRSALEALVDGGYRSALTIRRPVHSGTLRLTFLSRNDAAYASRDLVAAQHITDCLAVAVSHEQLATLGRERTEAHGCFGRPAILQRHAPADGDMPLPGRRPIVGRSSAWQCVLTRALRVASTDTTVLLQGESGTGKEVVARLIHDASPRRNGPFVAINCAALPDTLLESELFGFERGAFTGAQQPKPGQIELAGGGVLFLDEVTEMAVPAQAKLLRVLQEREYFRLGGTRPVQVNVRVIAASNQDLRKAVAEGRFREDLNYRINVFDVRIPPLRERTEDILPLAQHFLQEIAQPTDRPMRLTPSAEEALLAHHWPGNVRELRNVLERASIVCEGPSITAEQLSLAVGGDAPWLGTTDLGLLERQAISQAMREVAGNKARAAQKLGISRTQLYSRLRKYGLQSA